MNARFRFQVAVRECAGYFEGCALYSGRIPGLILQQRYLVAVLFAPARIHAEQHFGPVLTFGAAGARIDGDDGISAVIFTAQQTAHLQAVESLLEPSRLLLYFLQKSGVVFLFLKQQQRLEVFGAALQFFPRLDPVLLLRNTLLDFLRFLGIVPKFRVEPLLIQLLDQFLSAGNVKDSLRVL